MDLFAGMVTHKRAPTPPPKAAQQPPQVKQPPPQVLQPASHAARPATGVGIATVGDGGASWKARALKRARQRASDSGKSLDEIVQQRFHSVEDLVQGSRRAEPWRVRRGGGKGFDDRGRRGGGKGDRRGGESDGEYGRQRERSPKSDASDASEARRGAEHRGGGLRIGREARDADIISRYRGKVRSSSLRMGIEEGLDSAASLERREDRGTHGKKRPSSGHSDEPPASSRAKRVAPPLPSTAPPADPAPAPASNPNPTTAAVAPPKPRPPPPAVGSNAEAAAALRRSMSGGTATGAPTSGNTSSNEAAAQALRARLLASAGNATMAQVVAKKARPELVAPFDSQGRRLQALVPGKAAEPAPQKEDFKTGRWKGKLKVQGGSSSMAAADADMDVMDMVAEEREGGVDMDEVFARNVVRLGSNYKGVEASHAGSRAGMDEEEEVDMKMFATAASRMTAQKLKERQRQVAINEHRKAMQVMHTHPFSMENPNFKQHLVIARTEHAYVMLATRGALVKSHCFVVPIKQVSSTRLCQEEVFEDIQNFKSSLRRMFGANGQGIVFIETAAQGSRQWGKIEAIPVPLECEMDAPLYFKQALADVEGRVIDLSDKTIRKAIPETFPYFSCEWARGGLALAIDDVERFQADFGHGVLAGMMQLDPPQLRKNKGSSGASMEQEISQVAALSKQLDGYL